MFNVEIQDGRQNWRENVFRKKSPVDSLHFLDKRIFAFYTQIQDGTKSGGKTFFVKKSPLHFVEIALSRSISEINAFLLFQR